MIRMKIKDICDLQNGRAFKPSDWGTAGVPIIRIQNLNDERAPFNYYSGKYNLAQEVDNGDLLFSWSGTPGTSFGAFLWNRGKGVLNQHIFKVIPKVEVDKTYLMYALNGNISTIISKAHGGVGLQHITKKELDEIEIQMVSISRQKKIVEILEKISLLIFLRKQQIAKLDELVKARFVEMFGDPVNNPMNYPKSQLGKVCDVRDGTHDSPEYYDVGYPLVTSKNVTGGKIDLSECNLISEDDYKKICERSKVDRGDIIMPMIGTVGKPVIVNAEPMFAIKNVALIKFTPDSLVTNIYIKTLLESDYFDRAVLDKIRGGTQKFIALGDIRKLEIILPDLKHQQCFSAFVERVDQQKQTVQQSLEKLELMKKALMQEYFG